MLPELAANRCEAPLTSLNLTVSVRMSSNSSAMQICEAADGQRGAGASSHLALEPEQLAAHLGILALTDFHPGREGSRTHVTPAALCVHVQAHTLNSTAWCVCAPLLCPPGRVWVVPGLVPPEDGRLSSTRGSTGAGDKQEQVQSKYTSRDAPTNKPANL